jgi:hypothetical protein
MAGRDDSTNQLFQPEMKGSCCMACIKETVIIELIRTNERLIELLEEEIVLQKLIKTYEHLSALLETKLAAMPDDRKQVNSMLIRKKMK